MEKLILTTKEEVVHVVMTISYKYGISGLDGGYSNTRLSLHDVKVEFLSYTYWVSVIHGRVQVIDMMVQRTRSSLLFLSICRL